MIEYLTMSRYHSIPNFHTAFNTNVALGGAYGHNNLF
jgi:hypothetical protein